MQFETLLYRHSKSIDVPTGKSSDTRILELRVVYEYLDAKEI